jgi:TDG/mug DNA glycosylase family protein
MIVYRHVKPKMLFIGINPHFGSFSRGVPFSNNKMFWYLLSQAGLLKEKREELRDDAALKRLYRHRFNSFYGLGIVNLIDRPTRDVSGLEKDEETKGRKNVSRIIAAKKPGVVCFVGKITYMKFLGSKAASFGWQRQIGDSRIFVMHAPLRGKASIRVRELRKAARAAHLSHFAV